MNTQEKETMTDAHQERQEAYLELEHYIEALQSGRAAHFPVQMTMEQARIYRMATLFCSAIPGPTEPGSDFANALYGRLLAMKKEANDDRPPPP
jgi:hypothetical protein